MTRRSPGAALRSRAVAAMALGAVVSLFTAGPLAYSTFSRWTESPIVFYVNPANADVPESAAVAAIVAAADAWRDQSNASAELLYVGQASDTTTAYDGRNVIIFRNEAKSSTIASTYSWSMNGVMIEADMVFWDGGWRFYTGTSGCSGGAYIEDVATHELGHALGMLHSDDPDATMFPYYNTCSTSMRTLAADDVAGIEWLYPPGGDPSPVNTPPVVSIATPAAGLEVEEGSLVQVQGVATDEQDGVLSAALAWTSSLDGPLGTGASIPVVLSPGVHSIMAVVTDQGGLTGAAETSVTVLPQASNTAPSVAITAPSDGAVLSGSGPASFAATASDAEDGSLSGQIVWSSSLSGYLGSGDAITTSLVAGEHVVTASATDADGLSGSAWITLIVASGSTAPTLEVSAYKVKGQQTVDLHWSGLAGSSVDVFRNGTAVSVVPNTGDYTDSTNGRGKGDYRYRVCAAGDPGACTNEVSVSF